MAPEQLRGVLEAALLAAGRALTLDDFLALFEGDAQAPDRAGLRAALDGLAASLEGRAVELVQVASGYRLQVRREYSAWLGGLFAERPPRYSRALLETLALIAYRQPITRGEIEDVRGVAVSSNIIKTLMEREWVRVLGHREVPGRPALYGTTREFLDHFGLRSLDGLPPLAEVRDLDELPPDLFSGAPGEPHALPPEPPAQALEPHAGEDGGDAPAQGTRGAHDESDDGDEGTSLAQRPHASTAHGGDGLDIGGVAGPDAGSSHDPGAAPGGEPSHER